jgi:hypothetical protein
MGIYTPSQTMRHFGSDGWLRLAALLQFRAIALACALALSAVSTLYQVIFDGGSDLDAWSFGGFFAGEVVALISTVLVAVRAMPLTTLLHVGVTGAWLFVLLRYGAPIWSGVWAALGLPGS